jgi:Flp pilus assembly CpaE family ATPase
MHARDRATAAERGSEPPAGRPSRLTVVSEHRSGASAPDSGTEPRADACRGPLLAVCGLCGGAGASTLAYLVALAEARRRSAAVLVADTGGPGGGISCYAGVQAPRSLVEVADHVAAGLPVGGLFTAAAGLRVLATGPRFTPACARAGIELLLAYARERYALTVIDCGTLAREADQVALAKASHVAWVLPASTGGVRRARPVLEAINPYLPGRELIAARHDGGKAPLRELKRLAERHHTPLVLLPSVPDLATSDPSRALEAAQVPLQAILGALAR